MQFLDNAVNAGYDGGALYANCPASIIQCVFSGNTTSRYGGALELDGNNATITNSAFYNNTAGSYGGAIDGPGPSAQITNCTFCANVAVRLAAR